jgi:hypothetical protein
MASGGGGQRDGDAGRQLRGVGWRTTGDVGGCRLRDTAAAEQLRRKRGRLEQEKLEGKGGVFAWLVSHEPAILFSHNKPATSNQPAVLFSQNKSAPATSHQQTEQVGSCLLSAVRHVGPTLTVVNGPGAPFHSISGDV